MPGVNIAAIQDMLNLTRATELKQGSWVSFAADLPDYPLHTSLIPRLVRRSSFEYKWTVTREEGDLMANGGYTGINVPLQVSVGPQSKRLSVMLAKVRFATAYSDDEEELQGGSDEELADIVLMRKAEKLDLPLMSFLEHALAGQPSSGSPTYQELYGLKYWFPADTAATDLELLGGADPTNYSGGAAGLTVADCPEWAHAVAGYNTVSDDDLFDKLHEFRLRVNYFVPEGVKSLDSATPKRCIMTQHPTYLDWARVQTAANDNLRNDVGMWRGALNFMSTPVKILPVISEPGSAETPTDHALCYDLDLNTIKFIMHSAKNFDMQTMQKADTPGTVHAYREGYAQMVCINRRKNLVLASTNSNLIAG